MDSGRGGPSSSASLDAAASNVWSVTSHPPFGTAWGKGRMGYASVTCRMVPNCCSDNSQTHLSALLRLVTIKTFPAARAMGIAQHTTLGVERSFPIGEDGRSGNGRGRERGWSEESVWKRKMENDCRANPSDRTVCRNSAVNGKSCGPSGRMDKENRNRARISDARCGSGARLQGGENQDAHSESCCL